MFGKKCDTQTEHMVLRLNNLVSGFVSNSERDRVDNEHLSRGADNKGKYYQIEDLEYGNSASHRELKRLSSK